MLCNLLAPKTFERIVPIINQIACHRRFERRVYHVALREVTFVQLDTQVIHTHPLDQVVPDQQRNHQKEKQQDGVVEGLERALSGGKTREPPVAGTIVNAAQRKGG